MNFTSKTGLLPAFIKAKKGVKNENKTIELKAITQPAPYILKPFAGIYNPYSYGCSHLCNHPVDNEIKELFRKSKSTWKNVKERNLLLSEEIEIIKKELKQLAYANCNNKVAQVESVPEELFKRYTETDSRPLTPAPTLASAVTRTASDTRRCLTPDPILTNTSVREKTLLILDLRKSHSQETLSWSLQQETPLIRIQRAPTRSHSSENLFESNRNFNTLPFLIKNTKKIPLTSSSSSSILSAQDKNKNNDEFDEEIIKRRGKNKKQRKKRRLSKGPPPIPSDPETQIATINGVSREFTIFVNNNNNNQSESASINNPQEQKETILSTLNSNSFDINSFLDNDILKYFKRELNREMIYYEFDNKKKIVLQETLKTLINNNKMDDNYKELLLFNIKNELNLNIIDEKFWLSLPRIFNKDNVRFELPFDSRTLSNMTPLEYLKNNVFISSPQKFLYKYIFVKFKEDINENYYILGKNIPSAMDLIMGSKLSKMQIEDFKRLVKFQNNVYYDFQTFCGISAFCERLLGDEFCKNFKYFDLKPCEEIEIADFQSLEKKLHGKENIDKGLREILEKIKSTQ